MKNYKKIIGLSAMFLLTGGVVAATTSYVVKNATPTHEGGKSSGTVTPVNADITISFDPNGGVLDGKSTFTADGNTQWKDITKPHARMDGVENDYWTSDAEGKSKISDTTTLASISGKKAYAHYVCGKVTFDPDGGTIDGQSGPRVLDKKRTWIYGDEVHNPVKPNYTFNGWKVNDVKVTSYPYAITTDTTFVANWISNKVTIVVTCGDGHFSDNTGSYKSISVNYGTTWGQLTTIDKTAVPNKNDVYIFETGNWFVGNEQINDDYEFTKDTVVKAKYTNAVTVTFRLPEGAKWTDTTTGDLITSTRLMGNQTLSDAEKDSDVGILDSSGAFAKKPIMTGYYFGSDPANITWIDQNGNEYHSDSLIINPTEVTEPLILMPKFIPTNIKVEFYDCVGQEDDLIVAGYDKMISETQFVLPTENIHRGDDAEFKGWLAQTQSGGLEPISYYTTLNDEVLNVEEETLTKTPISVLKLHASYNLYNITLNAGEHGSYSPTPTPLISQIFKVHECDLEKNLDIDDGYVLIGWEDDFGRFISVEDITKDGGYTLLAKDYPNENVTFTAQYAEDAEMSTVTFFAGEGQFDASGTTSISVQVEKGTKIGDKAPGVPYKMDGTTKVYASRWVDIAGREFNPYYRTVDEESLSLFAEWDD